MWGGALRALGEGVERPALRAVPWGAPQPGGRFQFASWKVPGWKGCAGVEGHPCGQRPAPPATSAAEDVPSAPGPRGRHTAIRHTPLPHPPPLGCDLFQAPVVGTVMKLSSQAAPGVERYAEHAIENACHLADAAGPGGWSTTAADDALEAIDTLAAALSALGPEAAGALAPVTSAVTNMRQLLGLPADEGTAASTGAVPAPRTAPRRQRRELGLGPGFKGIRADR